jgi:hypothetical protein
MKQTAVEWLESRFIQTEGNLYAEDFTKAKEMEKQQVRNAWIDGKENKEFVFHVSLDAEQYYNETYKKQ